LSRRDFAVVPAEVKPLFLLLVVPGKMVLLQVRLLTRRGEGDVVWTGRDGREERDGHILMMMVNDGMFVKR